MSISVKYIPNIHTTKGTENYIITGAKTVRSALRKTPLLKTLGIDLKDHKIIVMGRVVGQKSRIKNGDQIIVTPEIEWPALVAIGKFVWAGFLQHWVTYTAIALTAGYSIYSYLNQPKLPNFGGIGDGLDESSPTYRWDGMQTTASEGIAKPVCFGEIAVPGNIINRYISTDGDKNYLNVLIALCEGEIDSIDQIYVNNQPIENFDGVTTYQRLGTKDQAVIPGFEDIHNQYDINTLLEKDDTYSYTTVNADVEAFEIRLGLPNGLWQQNADTGGYLNWSVTYEVSYSVHGEDDWSTPESVTISGKSRSNIFRIYREEGLTAAQYDIRITKTSDDSVLGPPAKTGDLYLEGVDEIQTDNLRYPNLVLVGLRLLATNQLSGPTPNFRFVIKGMKVSVPQIMNGEEEVDWDDYYWNKDEEEYQLLSDDTSLTWDEETFVTRYCANPIWCIQAAMTNKRWGAGDYVATSNINDDRILEESQHCEEKIQNGQGGYEKRYRLDVALDSQAYVMDSFTQLSACFRGFVFYTDTGIQINIDKKAPESADGTPIVKQIFGMGNIVKSNFSEKWESLREAYNEIIIQFLSEAKDYQWDYIKDEDSDSLANGDPRNSNTRRLFVTKASYALREARYAKKVARTIGMSTTVKAGIDAILVQAGELFGISHDVPQIGYSGRALSATENTLTLDRTVTIESGKTYSVWVQLKDDTILKNIVTNAPGTTNILTVSENFTTTPEAYNVYVFGESQILVKPYKTVRISRINNSECEITGIEYSADVFDDTDVIIPQSNYSSLSFDLQPAENLLLTETLKKAKDGTIFNTINVWFKKPSPSSNNVNPSERFRIYLSQDDGLSWIFKGETRSDGFIISDDIQDNLEYKVAVASVNWKGQETAIATSPQRSITIVGKTAPPDDVTAFIVRQSRDRMLMTWSNVADVDLSGYEIRYGVSWESGELLATQIKQNSFISFLIKLGADQSFWIKSIDTSGNYSSTATEALLTVDNIPFTNIIEEYSEQTAWGGDKSNTEKSGDNLIISAGELTGTYMTPIRDVGFVATFKIGIEAVITAAATGQWDDDSEDETWGDLPDTDRWSGLEIAGAASFRIKHSEDQSDLSGCDWETWTPGDYTCRYFQLEMTLTRTDLSQALQCSQFNYYADLPDVDEFGDFEIAVAADGAEITFTKEFHQIPSVNIDILTGDGYVHKFSVAPDLVGLTDKFYDMAGSAATGTGRYHAHGV